MIDGEIGMKYQLIVSTMRQDDDSLIKKMNINSNAIIINQSNKVSYHETSIRDYIVKW